MNVEEKLRGEIEIALERGDWAHANIAHLLLTEMGEEVEPLPDVIVPKEE